MSPSPTAAHVLVAALQTLGVERVFCVPGESYLAVLDALVGLDPPIEVIVCRHEASAANMAEAHAKLTGKLGVCLVTRGPGATHASVGLHTARQDSTPLLLLIGQVALADRTREAFQEIDYRGFFSPICKWAEELDQPDRVGEFIARAAAIATQGRPGPVALALPEDVLTASVATGPYPRTRPHPAGLSATAAAAIAAALGQADRPLIIAGGSGWGLEGRAALAALTAQTHIPVVLSFRRKDLLDNTDPGYGGDLGLGTNPKLLARIAEADAIMALGARLGENPSQSYGLFTPADTAAKLIHVHPDPEELGRVWPARIAAVADPTQACVALSALLGSPTPSLTAWRDGAHADAVAFRAKVAVGGRVNLSEVFTHLSDRLPADAIVCNGAGNYAAWLHRYLVHRAGGRQLAPTSGAMGYGLPAAIAAKLADPARTVVAVAGDGCFMMAAQELATAAQYRANIVVILVDNGSYGTIRMHQERHYPGRVIGTDLKNPDFVAFAQSFGFVAERVDDTTQFEGALERALGADRPALLHLVTSVDDISPGRRLSA